MTTTAATEPVYWSGAQKIALRFFLVFFLLYIFFNPNGTIPFLYTASKYYIQPFHKLIPWLAAHVLHMANPITVFTNGSGDTTYDYLIILFSVVVAGLCAGVWSVIDRKARNYNKLFYWVCVIVRYYVAITMLTYGFIKVIKLQFPSPSPARLLEPFGNASPMGLAWTYMGYSKGFNYFTGIGELSCGLLLLFRKTTTLGALLGVVVAGNIMAINYCFDVPVKLLSTMLVLMSLFLLAKDALRLINFFLLNRVAPPSNIAPHNFKHRWKNITLCCIKYVFIVYVLVGYTISNLQAAKHYGDKAKKPPFYGIYNVQSFVRNKDTIAPLTTDTNRWRKLVISYAGNAQINFMNDSSKRYNFKPDLKKHVITINTYADTVNKHYLTYAEAKNGDLVLKGKWDKDSLTINLKKYDLNDFLLLRRGFHWVNEYPLNR
jgi:hypothetical protein